MQKKLTVTIDEEVYNSLRAVIGPRKISRFIEDLVRPHVVKKDMYAAYKEMAADKVRESEALEWAEGTFGKNIGVRPTHLTKPPYIVRKRVGPG